MKLLKKIQEMGIFSKITLLTTCVIVLLSTLSTAFLLQQFSGNLKEKDHLLVREAAEKIYDFTNSKYNNIYNQRNLLHTTNYIAYIISTTRQNPSDIYHHENLNKITDYLTALIYSDETICDAIIFTSDGKHAFSNSSGVGRSVSISYDFNNLEYIENFKESNDIITMIYDPEPSYLATNTQNITKNTISLIAKIFDTTSPEKKIVTGYLMINYSPSSFFDTIDEIEIATSGSYYVVNSENKIVYCNDLSLLNTNFSDLSFSKHDILLNKSVGTSSIRVIGSVSDAELQSKINVIIPKMILITGLCIFCMIFITILLHKYYANKFHQLGTAMHDISMGNFNVKLPVKNQDEISYLSHSFNTMCETLDTYIQKTYLAETKRRTAELYALQAQINPHFLVNTIESIRMYAIENDNYEIAEMLKKFGNIFHCMIQFDSDIINMYDEMSYITCYMDLQKFRFQDRLSVNIDFPTKLNTLGIPRFTLQPIIENSLSYGSKDFHTLCITISFSTENDILIIRISDNGRGISKDTLDKLNDHIHSNKQYPEFGIALQNIHSRITILFGSQYGVHVDSIVHQGTIVTVTLPAKEKKELEYYVQTTYSR